jgi:hypothetical protein
VFALLAAVVVNPIAVALDRLIGDEDALVWQPEERSPIRRRLRATAPPGL